MYTQLVPTLHMSIFPSWASRKGLKCATAEPGSFFKGASFFFTSFFQACSKSPAIKKIAILWHTNLLQLISFSAVASPGSLCKADLHLLAFRNQPEPLVVGNLKISTRSFFSAVKTRRAKTLWFVCRLSVNFGRYRFMLSRRL